MTARAGLLLPSPFALGLSVLALGCGASPSAPPSESSASPQVTSVEAPPPAASAAPAAAPSASASAAAPPAEVPPAAPARKDVDVSIVDPVTDAKKTVHVPLGASVSVTLPEYPGTTWSIARVDKTLGAPKSDTVPSFVGPTTPGHKFTWSTGGPLLKSGESHVVTLVNKGGQSPTKVVLTLAIE